MDYEDFIHHYTPEIALLDAIDLLKTFPLLASSVLDRQVSVPKDDKNDVKHDLSGPIP